MSYPSNMKHYSGLKEVLNKEFLDNINNMFTYEDNGIHVHISYTFYLKNIYTKMDVKMFTNSNKYDLIFFMKPETEEHYLYMETLQKEGYNINILN